MADYYPLLARALDALPDRTPALRKAVYDRARSALIGQLRTLDPPLPDEAIETERKALDSAIERLESAYGAPAAAPPTTAATPPPPVVPRQAEAPVLAPEAPPTMAAPPPPPPEPEPEVQPSQETPPAALPVTSAPFMPVPPPPAEPEAPVDEPLPEPGPPPAFTPFVPPPRRARSEEPSAVAVAPDPVQEPDPAAASAPDVVPPENGNGRRRPKLDVKAPRAGRSRQLRNLFVGAVLAVVIGLIAVAAIMLADKRSDLPQSAGDGEGAAQPAPDAKLSDRVGGERSEAETQVPGADTGARSDLAVAQRAVLYEENQADPKAQPAATQGRVVWRLEAVNGEQGQPLQSAVRANVEYPEAGLTLSLTIRRNLDATLPASHTLELAFTNYGRGEKRTVQEIGLIQLKDEESSRGSPVSGLPVRVRDNLFLIGLSNLPADIERNTELLTHRNWFDLAIKYREGQRAILTFEKGTAGTRAMQDAFNQWR